MLRKAQHGRTDVSATQAADVTRGECAKVQGAPTTSVCAVAATPCSVEWKGGCWLDGTQQETKEDCK